MILSILLYLLFLYPVYPQVTSVQSDSGWINIFNGVDGQGMYTFLSGLGRNNDPNDVFSFQDGLIKVKSGPSGYIGSVDTFNYYITRVEFKFQNLGTESENAGLLYHIREFEPKRNGVWPVSVECQMQKRGVGEAWTIFGTRLQTTTKDPNKPCQYDPNGVEINHGADEGSNVGRQCLGSSNPYKDGEWNTMEVRGYGKDSVVHIVNDVVTFRGWNLRKAKDFVDMSDPLTGGNVAVQSEGAEILYRNFIIQPLNPMTNEALYAKKGCTVDSAINFDSTAVIDDDSCIPSLSFVQTKLKGSALVMSGNKISIKGKQPIMPTLYNVKGNKVGGFTKIEQNTYQFELINEGVFIIQFFKGDQINLTKIKYAKN